MTAARPGTLPTFALIGAARSGTTAITEALRRHPDAFVTTPKEPHYFAFAGEQPAFSGPGDDTGINTNAVTGTDDYLALYAGATGSVARGEGSVTTLYYHQHAIAAIRALNPEMRLLVVLRDPVERAYSSYQYLRMRGREPEPDFVTALSLEDSRRDAGWQHLWQYTAMSRYADALDAFLRAFPREQLLVLMYDEVTAHPANTLRRVFEHVGLDPARGEPQGAPRVNSSGGPRSARAQAVLNRLARTRSIRRTGRRMLPYAVRERVRRWNQTENALPAETRARLAPRFAEDLDRTESVLGLALPAWGRPPRA